MKNQARLIGLIVMLALCGAGLYFARGVCVTLLLASVVAYALHPFVTWLQRHRVPRPLGILLVLMLLSLLIAVTLAISLPELGRQMDHFAQNWPGYVAAMRSWIAPLIEFAEKRYPEQLAAMQQEALGAAQGFLPTALHALATALKGAATGVAGLVAWLVNAVMVPVLAYFLLADPGSLSEILKKVIPDPLLHRAIPYVASVDEVLRAWMRGQLTVAVALAIIYSVGLTLIGVPLGLLIGVVGGLANVIPYMGLVLGLLPAVLLSLLDSGGWGVPAMAAGVFVLGQMLEGTVITPRVMGSGLGLPPALVLIAVLAGGELFGVIGLLLAVPATAAIVVVLAGVKRNRAAAPAAPAGRRARPLQRPRPL